MSKLTVFACTRSGLSHRSLPPEIRLIEVPCTGRVSIPLMLASIAHGSDGVLVLGRHQDTCRLRGAEDPARDRAQRADELLTMVGFGSKRIRFVQPRPGLDSPLHELEQFAQSVSTLGPKPDGATLAAPETRFEGVDTSIALLRWFAAHRGASPVINGWLDSRALPSADESAPVLVAGIVPLLDRLFDQLTRPFHMSALLSSALVVLSKLTAGAVGILPHAWVKPDSEQARRLGSNSHVFTLCQRGSEKLSAAGVRSVIVGDLLRASASALPGPPVRARVATDGTQSQNSLVEALGYEPVAVGPDPLPDTFTLSPEHRRLADRRLAAAESKGASALLTPGPLTYARWALLARHGTWQSARVAPVMPHLLAHLSLTRTPLSLRSLENPPAGPSPEVMS